jgi:hypothetical protein
LTVTLLVVNTAADAPDARQPVPTMCPSPPPDATLPTWTPRRGAAHGFQQFERTTLIDLSQLDSVDVEIWGAGGGGGGGSEDSYTEGGAGGGGGASGGYSRGTLTLDRLKKHLVVVGDAGAGGRPGVAGQRGGDSALCENGTAILIAEGGPGGAGAISNKNGAPGGEWRRVAVHDPESEGALQRIGHDGAAGSAPLFEYRGLGGDGAQAVHGTIESHGSYGGAGGSGEMRPDPPQAGSPGGAGLVIVRW